MKRLSINLYKEFGRNIVTRQSMAFFFKKLKEKKSKEVVKWIKETKCHCTWGCANFINTIYNPKMYPKLLAKSLKYKMTDDSRDKIIFDNIKPQPVTY